MSRTLSKPIPIAPRLSQRAADWYDAHGDSRNASVEYVLELAPLMVDRTCAELRDRFDETEHNLMRDALNGTFLVPGLAGQHILADVEDHIQLNQADKNFGCDGPTLVEKLRRLSRWQLACVELDIRAWWKKTGDRQQAIP